MQIEIKKVTHRFADGTEDSGYKVCNISLSYSMEKIGMVERRRACDYIAQWVIEKYGLDGITLEAFWSEQEAFEASKVKPEEVMCDCGHWEIKAMVMRTSRGTSCVDCYDRMSD